MFNELGKYNATLKIIRQFDEKVTESRKSAGRNHAVVRFSMLLARVHRSYKQGVTKLRRGGIGEG